MAGGPGQLSLWYWSGLLVVVQASGRAKAPRFNTDDDDARRCRYLTEDVVLVLLCVSGFWVKTFVHSELHTGDALHRSSS